MWDSIDDALNRIGIDLIQVGITGAQIVVVIGISLLAAKATQHRVERLLSLRSFGRNGAVLIGRLVSTACVIVGALIVLALLGADWTGLLTLLSIGTVAIGLAIQDVLKNFVAGIFLLMERPFRVGDRIKIREVDGEVQGIDVRTTLVRSTDGSLVMVPNALVFTEILTNQSRYRTRRLDLTITAGSLSIPDIERMTSDVLKEMQGVRTPIPAPTIRTASPDGATLELSLLIDANPGVEGEVVGKLIQALGDSTVEVQRP